MTTYQPYMPSLKTMSNDLLSMCTILAKEGGVGWVRGGVGGLGGGGGGLGDGRSYSRASDACGRNVRRGS